MENLADLPPCVGNLPADIQLIVFVILGNFTKNSALVSKDGEKLLIRANNVHFHFSIFAGKFYEYFFPGDILNGNALILIYGY